jgi:hypothetical protein
MMRRRNVLVEHAGDVRENDADVEGWPGTRIAGAGAVLRFLTLTSEKS